MAHDLKQSIFTHAVQLNNFSIKTVRGNAMCVVHVFDSLSRQLQTLNVEQKITADEITGMSNDFKNISLTANHN